MGNVRAGLKRIGPHFRLGEGGQIAHMKKDSGFTLIELMIVVAIIGILASIAIPQYIKYIKRTRTTEGLAHLKNLYDSLVDWYSNPDLGNGSFASNENAMARTGGLSFSSHFVQEGAWWNNGDLSYTYVVTSVVGPGGGIIPNIQASARNPEAVFGRVLISTEHGEGTISSVSPSY